AKAILSLIARLVRHIPNYISITGHTNSIRYTGMTRNYTNWELSADRANAVRRFLISVQMDPEQIARVVGKADLDPIDREHPNAAANRRISLVLLKKSVLPYH